jgi:hypothetical protein
MSRLGWAAGAQLGLQGFCDKASKAPALDDVPFEWKFVSWNKSLQYCIPVILYRNYLQIIYKSALMKQ